MTLFVTEFDRSVKNRVIHSDDCTATVNKNVAGGPCTLMSIVIDNIEGDTTNYVRCSNGSSGTVGSDDIRVNVPCAGVNKEVVEFPGGIPFNRGLSFWCSSGASITSTSAPSTTASDGKIKVTLVLG